VVLCIIIVLQCHPCVYRNATDLLLLLNLSRALGAGLLLGLALLQEGLGDEDLVGGGHGSVQVSRGPA
jgi:hypothetical protein